MSMRNSLTYADSVLRPRIIEGMNSEALADLELIVRSRINALVCGPQPVLQAALERLQMRLGAVHRWPAPKGVPPANLSGVLLLEEVTACTLDQQQRLLDWLNAASDLQVITAVEWPLFDAVQRGDFLAPLYYRLNMIHVDLYALTSDASASGLPRE